jgi:hypothetical protein
MSAGNHKRNIEIKAKFADKAEFDNKISIAKQLTGSDGEILIQHDVFFTVPNGRLKLRYEVNSIHSLSKQAINLSIMVILGGFM